MEILLLKVHHENHETLDSHFENITGITSLNFGLGSANTIQNITAQR